MPDVLDTLRDTDPVPRNRWSDTAEGRATRERVFDSSIAVAKPRRRTLSALVAAAVVLTIVASVLVVIRGSERTIPASARDFVHGKWSVLVAGPATGMQKATTIWTGKELIVWGRGNPGEQVVAPAPAAYNPRTQDWRRLDPPVSVSIVPVWTGSQMIVWTGSGPGDFDFGRFPVPGAAYDPARDKWRSIALAPVTLAPTTTAVWTGRELVVVGAVPACLDSANCSSDPVGAAAYDPSTDTWRLVPNAPIELSDIHAVWDGRQVVTWGLRGGEPAAIAYEPSRNSWLALPSPPFALGGSAVVPLRDGPLWIGMQTRFLSTPTPPPGVVIRATSFDARHGWALRATLHEGSICPVAAAKVASFVVVLCAPGDRSAVLDLATGRWRTLRSPPRLAGEVVWTGKELLGLSVDGAKLLEYRPAG